MSSLEESRMSSLGRSRTSSLEAIRYVVSRVEIAPETWLRDAWCYVHCTCIMCCYDISMADVLSFAFEVGCESFFGQILMHLCVHLLPCGCTSVHSGTGAGMNVHSLFFKFFVWRPFCFLPSSCSLISSIRSPFWISFEGDSNQIFIKSEPHASHYLLPTAYCTLYAGLGAVCCRCQGYSVM